MDVNQSTRITAVVDPTLVEQLKLVVGSRYVLTSLSSTRRYRTGYRSGSGPVAAVVRPRTLAEQWQVLSICVAADVIVIIQAANTGLTGGSTPARTHYDRPIGVISATRITGVHMF